MTDKFNPDNCLGCKVYDPYINGSPKFYLYLFDLFTKDSYGKWQLGYEFYQDEELIFSGDDFHVSPLVAIDSDECYQHLMTFLTLRPGDTDEEYFDDYTERQMEFAEEHAETLSIYAIYG